ncbi:MAG: hypothetical protein JNJ61_28890 [Anaerolineae bacterium]|nr:hypothetical protein [Anaerolineae bacterium]
MMHTRTGAVVTHVVVLSSITALIALCMVYPFLPGAYDGLSVGISLMAQVFGIVGLPLVPLGGLWFAYEFWRRARRRNNRPARGGGFVFAVITAIVATLAVAAVAVIGAATSGLALGLLAFVLWLYAVFRFRLTVKRLKDPERQVMSLMPLYLMVIPVAALLLQLALAAPVTQMSRDRAIATSAEIIEDIEAYHARHGSYPGSLFATWPDYAPGVVGIAQYHYVAQGDAYNLVFQQPRFLLDDIGVREFVVYNPLDQQRIISHTSWILLLSPAEARRSPGWFASRNAPHPHWKYFWFD